MNFLTVLRSKSAIKLLLVAGAVYSLDASAKLSTTMPTIQPTTEIEQSCPALPTQMTAAFQALHLIYPANPNKLERDALISRLTPSHFGKNPQELLDFLNTDTKGLITLQKELPSTPNSKIKRFFNSAQRAELAEQEQDLKIQKTIKDYPSAIVMQIEAEIAEFLARKDLIRLDDGSFDQTDLEFERIGTDDATVYKLVDPVTKQSRYRISLADGRPGFLPEDLHKLRVLSYRREIALAQKEINSRNAQIEKACEFNRNLSALYNNDEQFSGWINRFRSAENSRSPANANEHDNLAEPARLGRNI